MLSITTTEAAPFVVIFDEWAPRTLNPCSVVTVGALCAHRKKMMGFGKPRLPSPRYPTVENRDRWGSLNCGDPWKNRKHAY